jgi:hypothetical protein
MKKLYRSLGPLALSFLIGASLFGSQSVSVARSSPTNKVLARALAVETGKQKVSKYVMPLSSGVMYTLLQASGRLEAAAAKTKARPQLPSTPGTQGCQNVFAGNPSNTRVNQDCSRRRQAEEVIVVNPNNPQNFIAGQNDSRVGFNHCGYDWSFDAGQTWGDQVPPFWQFILADGHTADACSDPTATFDAKGNAYVGGVLFDVNSDSSAVVVAKSNNPIGGAFYHTPVPGAFQEYLDAPLGVISSDPGPDVFNDKEFVVADAHPGSPKANNVYMTWTRFTLVNSPIYFSQSTDGGATWSPGVEISGSNPALCTAGSVIPGACDQDQGSDPIVGPDGTIYVAFGNGNTPGAGINQVLFVKCPAAADCSNSANWTPPVKVGDLIDNHPTGPSPQGCPAGRQCLPPNGYRVPEFTSISTSIDNSGRLYTVWSDFRNGGAPCTGPASSATPPCDNDVFFASSTNGGATWSSTVNVTPASRFAATAQWQPWSSVSPDGRSLWIAYYDRSYGNCEFDGCNDITLAKIRVLSTVRSTTYTRITTASMPNLTPANNPAQAGFLGDYMWVTVDSTGRPHIVWADTRGLNNTVEEDIYYATVSP